MSKFSVKKPLTIFVIVIVILALGVVSLIKMTPDLIPSMDLPYMVVMTTYPGATPEEVEQTVTKPLEQSLATLENIKTVQSLSSANYSMIIMEFENGSSMDTAVVSTLQNVDIVAGSWDDKIGSPFIMKINPSMIPISVAAVDMEGMTTEEISTYVDDVLMNKLEGITGVASISTGGMIESKLNVVLNEDKIEELNDKLLNKADADLADARKKINSGLKAISKAESEIAQNEKKLENSKGSTYDQLSETKAKLDLATAQAASIATRVQVLEGEKQAIEAQINGGMYGEQYGVSLNELKTMLVSINTELQIVKTDSAAAQAQLDELNAAYIQAEKGSYTAADSFNEGIKQLSDAKAQLKTQKGELTEAKAQLDKAAEETLKNTNLGEMITMDMVSGILQAQNFDMPAGYLQEGDLQYLVSVGNKINDEDELKDLLLFKTEGIGNVRVEDVADVFWTDNSDKVYASINGNPAVLLTFSKQSNYATALVSNNIKDKFEELEADNPGLSFTSLMDQGEYIYLIIDAILESLIYGAVFAIIVLLIFLRDFKPTLITLLSIPISIMFAIGLMYFSGVTLNLISLSGLAIAVGMLVDNSIVVIENIFRLRRMGMPAKKAAVMGAKEVGAAITSSTLTTVCVFAPIVFVQGITRELFTDLALTVTYSLAASLLIALTLVPAMASRMLIKEPRKEREASKKFVELYSKFVNFNLNHKLLVVIVAVGLFAYSIFGSVQKGLIFIPDMATPQMTGTLTMNDEDATLEETKNASDEAINIIRNMEGVETVGAMLSATSTLGSFMGDMAETSVSLYIIMDQDSKLSGGEIEKNIEEATKDLPCTVDVISSSSISEYTSALSGSGVTLRLYGTDNDALTDAAKLVGEKFESIEGIAEVDNGLEEADPEYHFVVDKDKAMKKGLTVAQIYMAIADAMTTENTATTLNLSGTDYDIVISTGTEESIDIKEIQDIELDGKKADGSETKVKIKDVTQIENKTSLPTINRLNQRTNLAVTGELKEGYNVTLVTDAVKEAMSGIQLPAGVSYEFDGENEMIMDAMVDLLEMMGLGILLVYLIMVAQFQSLVSPFIVMFTIPLAFTGGLLALLIFGKEISIMAMIGLIILVGVIVNNGIVLVDYINQLRAGGMEKREAILKAGATRIRPVLMTSLTTILGLIVLGLGKTAGTDMMQPIALVCIGGLVYATLLTLLVVPVMYDIFTKKNYQLELEDDF